MSPTEVGPKKDGQDALPPDGHDDDAVLADRSTGGIAIFVRRPIFAFVLNALIIVAGLAGFFGIEVRELPDVDRPVISIRTEFTGAAPETIDREVTEVVEGAVARVSGVKSISSSSEFGDSRVTIEFNDNVDLNVAASDVRDAMGRAAFQLPEDSDDPIIIKADADAQAIMRLAVTADSMNIEDLTVLVEDEVVDRLAAVEGVADVQVYGDREKIFQVDVDQSKLASRGLTVADLRQVLDSVSYDVPAGSLSSANQDLVVRATAEVTSPAEFEALYIDGRVRVADVAVVTLEADDAASGLRSNGRTGIGMGIIRQAQSNTLDISSGVEDAVSMLRSEVLPEGTDIRITSDDAVFIQGALHEVEIALAVSVVAVLIVIFLFLGDWRATLIPMLTLPVALIGTLAAIYLAGFSLNILTMLAIVLATGLVVDDAIIVLENIVRRRAQGVGRRAAAVVGTREMFFAVVTTTATLAAVFVPISFLPGQTGGLFREFGFVLAFSVGLSSLVALTLCPMLASIMLTKDAVRHHGQGKQSLLGRFGGGIASLYGRALSVCLGAPFVVVLIAGLFLVAGFLAVGTVRQELTPREDRSFALMRISAPQGVSLDYMNTQVRAIEAQLQPLVESGEIINIFTNTGSGGEPNSAFVVMTLAPWGERERSQAEIVEDINAATAQVPSVRAFAIQPNSLGIRGAGNGLQFAIVGNTYEGIAASAETIVERLENDARFNQVRLSYETTQPQLFVAINRERAHDLGIDITGLSDTIQAMVDGREVGEVFVEGRAVPVMIESTTNPINDPTDLENIFLRTADGQNVPMSTIATVEERAIAPELDREEQLRSVTINAALVGEFALGTALTEVEAMAAEVLTADQRIIPLAEAATLEENASGMIVTFGFAVLIIFLVLSAQFESFIGAVIVMATVPLGLACAIFALILTGGTLNIYSQIGLVLLVGIMAKNGILIVEFADQLRDRGKSVREAIEQACAIRLRPVMMTMIATIIGGVPLVLASGAGAEARIALGWIIVGGLALAVLATLFVTPVAYLLLARFTKPRASEEARLLQELDEAAALRS
ncbi:efflux RND transporter permease subunit [Pararhizobium haloflavum]|uniref:efflux RND transporter permease subunit n=1 Tax=Pararhizobium haloflavum TaxID=2037914 RepID=UPI000C17B3CA|nr:efflux RND transporter permease subunit [Pararhizobium haloflavum]